MKKTSLVLGLVLIIIGLLFTKVSAIDMNLINSIRQNDQLAAENLSATDNVSSTSNQILSNFLPTNSSVSNGTSQGDVSPSPNISNVSQTSSQSESLGINGVINIILIVVGILIILLGIAILIRTK